MEKKYILTDETKVFNGHILHRIQALKSFGNVNENNLGGWIQSEKNLSQEGNCWISNNAKVYGNARIEDEAMVYGDAQVFGESLVYDTAKVDYEVSGNEEIDK